jgi:hypothetical protein
MEWSSRKPVTSWLPAGLEHKLLYADKDSRRRTDEEGRRSASNKRERSK